MKLIVIVAVLLPAVLILLAVGPATKPALQPTSSPATRPLEGTTIHVWPARAPRATTDKPDDTPTLTCFWPAAGKAVGTSVVVCPGGGYAGLMMDGEGTDVARWLADHGVATFVLKYRVNRQQPAPMLDGQRAVRLVRARARDWGLDPNRVGIMGFSAGGHVASSVGTHYDDGIIGTDDPVSRRSCRPDFMLLIYPVITMQEKVTHPGSKLILLGEKPPKKLVDFYSNELQVTDDTPPAFLAASKTDEVVPVKNSELFADALKRHKVAAELLELPTGNHGFGMAKGQPELSVWTDKCLAWMGGQDLLKPTPMAKPTESKPKR